MTIITTIAVWLLVISILSLSSVVSSAVEIEGECSATDQTCTTKTNNDEVSFEFGTDTASVPDTTRSAQPECEDKEERCAGWAKMGECDANPNYMLSE